MQGENDIEYPYQVPDDSYFVLGDDRSSSLDSRTNIIGIIKKENIIGKIILRLWPISKVGIPNWHRRLYVRRYKIINK